MDGSRIRVHGPHRSAGVYGVWFAGQCWRCPYVTKKYLHEVNINNFNYHRYVEQISSALGPTG